MSAGPTGSPDPVRSWYLACASSELGPGQVRALDFMGTPLVLFRGRSGSPYALSAHCSHLGTHLGHGRVDGDRLRCPMHGWEYDGHGVCRRIPAREAIPERACQQTYPVAERYGAVFVFHGPEALYPPPALEGAPEAVLRTGLGRTVRLRCPWAAVGANAFDIQHLQAVHRRALREEPVFGPLSGGRFRMRYVTRVTGKGLTDRVMRWLSGDRITATITSWAGGVLTVESDLGRVRSALLLGISPEGAGTVVRPVFALRKSGVPAVDRLRVAAANWLYCGFLYRDVAIMDETHFRPHFVLPEDRVIHDYVRFLEGLPRASGSGAARPFVALG